jgi:hypothetical protein
MTTDKSSLARMDVPEIRQAFINWRLAQLKQLAAQTAIDFWHEQPQPSFRQQLLERMRRANGQRRERSDPIGSRRAGGGGQGVYS